MTYSQEPLQLLQPRSALDQLMMQQPGPAQHKDNVKLQGRCVVYGHGLSRRQELSADRQKLQEQWFLIDMLRVYITDCLPRQEDVQAVRAAFQDLDSELFSFLFTLCIRNYLFSLNPVDIILTTQGPSFLQAVSQDRGVNRPRKEINFPRIIEWCRQHFWALPEQDKLAFLDSFLLNDSSLMHILSNEGKTLLTAMKNLASEMNQGEWQVDDTEQTSNWRTAVQSVCDIGIWILFSRRGSIV